MNSSFCPERAWVEFIQTNECVSQGKAKLASRSLRLKIGEKVKKVP